MKNYLITCIFLLTLLACSPDEMQPEVTSIEETIIETNTPESTGTEDPTEESNPTTESQEDYFIDNFDVDGLLIDYVVNNEEVLPKVSSVSGRYQAILDDNSNNKTLHFNQIQGRIDAKLVKFPFEFIARNIGIGTLENSQKAPEPINNPFLFSGVQVHVKDFSSINSSHVVVGHRGGTEFTVEGKNTNNGSSSVNDIGRNTVQDGRADIRIVGTEEKTLVVYWQIPNMDYAATDDNWILYRGTGDLPGATPAFDDEVYIGLITYAYGQTGVPFLGTCDAIQIWN